MTTQWLFLAGGFAVGVVVGVFIVAAIIAFDLGPSRKAWRNK